ncbi:MAG: MBL fold metallo-hydrolase [Archaeoglobaceae archaeon]
MEVDRLDIVILSDNSVNKPGKFKAEYGFSAYLKVVGEHELGILFDTGCGLVIEDNMLEAGICWEDVDYVLLSHRHFDHTGGLLKVVENCKAPIIAHPDVFRPNFLWMRGRMIEASMPYTKTQLEAKGARFVLTREAIRLMEGVFFGGEIPRVSGEKTGEFFTLENGKIVRDEMLDDTAIFVKTKRGGVVLTGCAHSGIINTVLRGKELLGDIYAVLGGFHLMFSSPQDAERVMERVLRDTNLASPLHCSGSVAQSYAMKLGKYLELSIGAKVSF